MAFGLTRGGLEPGKISSLSGPTVEVKFMFNPTQYAITKSNTWSPPEQGAKGVNVPFVEFKQGGAMQIANLELWFDTLAEGTDVRRETDKLWKLMLVDESKKNKKSGKSMPPPVAFEWGKLYFKAIITTMTHTYLLFTPEGRPVRCKVTLTLQQYEDGTKSRPQVSDYGSAIGNVKWVPTLGLEALTAVTVAASVAIASAKLVVAVAGDRADHVAEKSTGDSNDMRAVAERNNIDDPLKIQPGTVVS